MSLVSVTKISSLMLASVVEQASLSLTWSETPKTRFVVSWLTYFQRDVKFDADKNNTLLSLNCLHAAFNL